MFFAHNSFTVKCLVSKIEMGVMIEFLLINNHMKILWRLFLFLKIAKELLF